MKRTCKQCGKEFEIFQSEINFYKSKNLQLPKRCKDCREANKQKKPDAGHVQEKKPEESTPPVTPAVAAPVTASKPEQSSRKPAPGNKLLYFAAAVLIVIISLFIPKNTENSPTAAVESEGVAASAVLTFRNETMLNEHYQKHGVEMGFSSAEEYQKAAAEVAGNEDALHKTEAEDGDDVYYLADTNEFVIVSTDGYIRTYFNPDDGIDYYNRQ